MSGDDEIKIISIFPSKKVKQRKGAILSKDANIRVFLEIDQPSSDEIIQIEYDPSYKEFCDLTKLGADILKEAIMILYKDLQDNYK